MSDQGATSAGAATRLARLIALSVCFISASRPAVANATTYSDGRGCSLDAFTGGTASADIDASRSRFRTAVREYERQRTRLAQCPPGPDLDRTMLLRYLEAQELAALVSSGDIRTARTRARADRIGPVGDEALAGAGRLMRAKRYRKGFGRYRSFFANLDPDDTDDESADIREGLTFAGDGTYAAAEASMRRALRRCEPTRRDRVFLLLGEVRIARGDVRGARLFFARAVPEEQAYTQPFSLDDFEKQAALELQATLIR